MASTMSALCDPWGLLVVPNFILGTPVCSRPSQITYMPTCRSIQVPSFRVRGVRWRGAGRVLS